MKKMLLILCGLLLAGTQAFAHSPTDIKIQFDNKTKVLTAIIEHRVTDPKSHFIKRIAVGLNGKEIMAFPFRGQETNTHQTIKFAIPQAKKGDTLSVEGDCGLNGKLEKKIKIA